MRRIAVLLLAAGPLAACGPSPIYEATYARSTAYSACMDAALHIEIAHGGPQAELTREHCEEQANNLYETVLYLGGEMTAEEYWHREGVAPSNRAIPFEKENSR